LPQYAWSAPVSFHETLRARLTLSVGGGSANIRNLTRATLKMEDDMSSGTPELVLKSIVDGIN